MLEQGCGHMLLPHAHMLFGTGAALICDPCTRHGLVHSLSQATADSTAHAP